MTVAVIEDDEVVRDTLALYLEQAGFDVEVASDGVRGLELAQQAGVAAVILDLMIPGLSGTDLCRRLRQTSAVPVLMLTARASEEHRLAGFDLGADDYVAKPFSPREVVARVQALVRRSGATSGRPEPVTLRGLTVDTWARQALVDGRAVTLTPTEFRLLEAMARHPGRIFTRAELVARVFGPDYDGLDRTIDVHVTSLRRKLDPQNPRRFVGTAHGFGYRLVDQ